MPDEVERFIRCPHCGLPHTLDMSECPVTGRALELPRSRPGGPPMGGAALSASSSGEKQQPGFRPKPGNLEGRLLEGKYLVEKLIGEGAMGRVYRGTHTRLQRRVAIKVISRGHAPGSDAEQRFYREARIAGSIGHPNIVEVFDLGTLEDGSPFIVMQHLEGETLAARLRRDGPLPIEDAFEIAARVLSALIATHAKGVVHRDLKADNVFLTSDPISRGVRLLDFGISKQDSHDELGLTGTGVVVGTPYYLAPEQARGEKSIDHRVDIYAAGVMIFEMLTGQLPLRADNYNAQLMKIVQEPPPPPSTLRHELSPAVDSLVLTAMAKDPADRYQSAAEMLDAVGFAAAFHSRPAPIGDETEVSDSFMHFDLKLPRDD